MDEATRRHIALILEHEAERSVREAHDANQATIAKNAAEHILQTGGTIKRAIAQCAKVAHRALDDVLIAVAEVDKSEEAFALLRTGYEAFIDRLESEELFYIARIASGRGRQMPEPSAWEAAQREFGVHRAELSRRLDIAAFSFRSHPDPANPGTVPAQPPNPVRKNKGGKPLAAHWDAMWASIAVKLWTGELKPKSQADLKAAMFDWFNQTEIEIGDTALTQRARQLWQAMQEAGS